MSLSTMPGRLRPWRVRIARSNPLVRRADRIEALVLALAIVVSALAVPWALYVHATVYAQELRAIDEQVATRHVVDAVALSGSTTAGRGLGAAPTAHAQWMDGQSSRTGMVRAAGVKAGDHIQIWVDQSNQPTSAPQDRSMVPADSAATAIVMWLSVVLVCGAFAAIARIALDHRRYRGWDRELRELLGNDDERKDRRL